ncbi:MAG: hypothetical protein MK345_01830 [SAR202 cluster bacterium]|nr:hypothetical protein [SAR202 cluster bacterium]
MQSINKQFNPSPAEITNYFGDCISLFPIDKQFNDISIGLYLKDSNYTIWSFSHLPKTKIRIQSICQQFENLLGLKLAENSHNQLFFECGDNHTKPLKFLFAQVVAKPPDFKFNDQNLQIKDSKSEFLITVLKSDEGYQVKLNSDDTKSKIRLRMINAGFVKYGGLNLNENNHLSFSCGQKHDKLMKMLLPYSRNLTSIDAMLEAEAQRGQMTTNTLGFSQT